MRIDSLIRGTGSPPQVLVSTVPAFVGLLVGGVLVTMSGSRLISLVGLGIIMLTFVFSDIWAVKRVLLAIVVLEIPIQVDIYINHDALQAATAAISGFNVSVTTVGLLALYGLWIVEIVAGAAPSPRPILRAALPAIVYSVVLLGSAFVAIDTNLVLYEAVIVFQALLVMIYVIHAVETRRDVLFVLGLLMVGILIQVGASLLTYVLGSAFDVGVVSTRAVGGRVAGTLGHPNSLGGFLALLLPTAAALVVAPVAHWYRWLAAVTFATGTVVLGLSQSRGGFLAYIAAMIVLAGLVHWRRLVPRTVLVRGSILAIIPLSLQIAVVGSRLMDFDNNAALSRLPLMRLAFAMIQGNVVWGVGANNFAAALDQYVTVEFSTAWISTVHNRYLLSWAETGIIGLVALLWFLVSILRRALEVVRRSDRLLALVAAGLLAGVFANMIHMSVDIFNSRPLVQLLWLVAGLVIAVERIATNPATRTMS